MSRPHTISIKVGYVLTLIHSECGDKRRNNKEHGLVLTIFCWDMFTLTESSGNLVQNTGKINSNISCECCPKDIRELHPSSITAPGERDLASVFGDVDLCNTLPPQLCMRGPHRGRSEALRSSGAQIRRSVLHHRNFKNRSPMLDLIFLGEY